MASMMLANPTPYSRTGGQLVPREDYNFDKAKQKASLKWLLCKAYEDKVPVELQDPFYKDHLGIDQTKPHIVHALANAELYCMALSNLYGDPNFHNLNHSGIIQALARKGILVLEPTDCSLTETVLIQTTPLKMSAHMAVTEALMTLFIKETIDLAKVKDVVTRLVKCSRVVVPDSNGGNKPAFSDQQDALLQWCNTCCRIQKNSIGHELQNEALQLPDISSVGDMCHGIGLLTTISLYCPKDIIWQDMSFGSSSSMSDSVLNIQLLQNFCNQQSGLLFCHLSIEDFLYLDSSIHPNVIAFMADLFLALEVHPIRPAFLPGSTKKLNLEIPNPDMTNRDFEVRRGKSIPTLSSVKGTIPRDETSSSVPHLSAEGSEKPDPFLDRNQDAASRIPEHGGQHLSSRRSLVDTSSIPVAGIPSEVKSPAGNKRIVGGGRRSRRNSIDETSSQLSLENLGGSQENVHLLGRNPDKEMKAHSGRKWNETKSYGPDEKHRPTPPSTDSNSSNVQSNKSIPFAELSRASPPPSGEMGFLPTPPHPTAEQKVSFADIRKQKAHDQFHSSGISINYMQYEQDEKQSNRRSSSNQGFDKATTDSPHKDDATKINGKGEHPDAMASQLNSVRIKLEQRRRRIEEEKKKMETIMSKQREKVGQTAFFRALGVKANSTSDLIRDLSAVESKWLSDKDGGTSVGRGENHRGIVDGEVGFPDGVVRTPDIEAMDAETYSRNLNAMNHSLHDLQADIQRLSQQQSQIQNMMQRGQQTPGTPSSDSGLTTRHNPMEPQPFFIAKDSVSPLHPSPSSFSSPSGSSARRTWGQPQPPVHYPGTVSNSGNPNAFQHQLQQRMLPQGPQPYQSIASGGNNQVSWNSPARNQQWQLPPAAAAASTVTLAPGHSHHSVGYQQQNPLYDGAHIHSGYTVESANFSSTPGTGGIVGATSYQGGHLMSRPPPPPPPLSHVATTANIAPTSFRLHEVIGQKSGHVMDQQAYETPVAAPPNSESSRSRFHSSIPAPKEDEMAPQSVSFIQADAEENDEAQDDDVDSEPTQGDDAHALKGDHPLKRLPDRLSQLNISSGSKTYRVHSDKDASSPSPTRMSRPSISSTFKQNRRNSNSGPDNQTSQGLASSPFNSSSPSGILMSGTVPPQPGSSGSTIAVGGGGGSGHQSMTEEEAETLALMKTERLKDDADAAKGFVISFDDDAPKKPKPPLKQRRPSVKRTSRNGVGNLGTVAHTSADGSKSSCSRKENVPPEVMICIDMNMGDEEDSSDAERVRKPIYSSSSPSFSSPGNIYPAFTSNPGSGNGGGGNLKMSPPINTLIRNTNYDPTHWKSYNQLSPTDDGPGGSGDCSDTAARSQLYVKQDQSVLPQGNNGGGGGGTLSLSAEPDQGRAGTANGLIITDQLLDRNTTAQDEMQRKKERIMMQSLRRKQQVEENRLKSEDETRRRRQDEKEKEEAKHKKKEEERIRRDFILEQHRLKKDVDRSNEDEARIMPKPVNARPVPKLRSSSTSGRQPRPRPKTIHVDQDSTFSDMFRQNRGHFRGSSSNLSGNLSRSESRNSLSDLRDHNGRPTGASSSPANRLVSSSSRNNSASRPASRPNSRGPSRRGSMQHLNEESLQGYQLPPSGLTSKTMDWAARQASAGRRKTEGRETRGSRESLASGLTFSGRRGSSSSLYGGPGSLPGYRRRGDFDDCASDISSASGFSTYGNSGTRLYREPATKSNRTIILNAVEFVVFPGVVNRETRERVLDVIDRCDCSHFLLLFRDQKCQFRGLYAYYPDTEEVYKIYGTGPKQVTEKMFDVFFKYNSGGKKFTKIHTKHLTVTIDAFTIHNNLWLGKKSRLPDKKDMALVL